MSTGPTSTPIPEDAGDAGQAGISQPAERGAQRWAEQWMDDLNCPLCGSAYDAVQLQPIRKDAERWLLSVQCFCCGTGSLITTPAFMAAEPVDAQRAGLIRAELPPFSREDVQVWRQLLHEFQGDWVRLWLTLRYSTE